MKSENTFLTFILAMIPGAGMMYLGAMRLGTLIMFIFCSAIWLASAISFSLMALILPVIWFYAFFKTFQFKKLDEDGRLNEEKRLISISGKNTDGLKAIFSKRHLWLGILLCLVGLWLTIDSIILPILSQYGIDIAYPIYNRIPDMFLSLALIVLGVMLVKGRKKNENGEIKGYGGKKDE